jgi:hypothetical protein
VKRRTPAQIEEFLFREMSRVYRDRKSRYPGTPPIPNRGLSGWEDTPGGQRVFRLRNVDRVLDTWGESQCEAVLRQNDIDPEPLEVKP